MRAKVRNVACQNACTCFRTTAGFPVQIEHSTELKEVLHLLFDVVVVWVQFSLLNKFTIQHKFFSEMHFFSGLEFHRLRDS